MRRLFSIIAISCLFGAALARAGDPGNTGDMGIGTISGSVIENGAAVPVRGYISVIDARSAVVPLATGPDLAACDAAAPLHRETTLAWQARAKAPLAFNAGYFWMPSGQAVPECQLPAYPYKSASFDASRARIAGHAAAVLALKAGATPVIAYADEIDPAQFDVVVSGDWVRGADDATVHRNLLLDHGQASGSTDLAPRTAVGVQRGTGRLVVVVVEGRRRDAGGMSLHTLADLMRACGVDKAINLDGGGSATFSYDPELAPVVKTLQPTPLSEACSADALNRDGLSVAIDQHALDQPLRSRAPGGPEVSRSGPDKGYRRVLTSIGFTPDGFRPDPRAPQETGEARR
jgi:hypothetical protein